MRAPARHSDFFSSCIFFVTDGMNARAARNKYKGVEQRFHRQCDSLWHCKVLADVPRRAAAALATYGELVGVLCGRDHDRLARRVESAKRVLDVNHAVQSLDWSWEVCIDRVLEEVAFQREQMESGGGGVAAPAALKAEAAYAVEKCEARKAALDGLHDRSARALEDSVREAVDAGGGDRRGAAIGETARLAREVVTILDAIARVRPRETAARAAVNYAEQEGAE